MSTIVFDNWANLSIKTQMVARINYLLKMCKYISLEYHKCTILIST